MFLPLTNDVFWDNAIATHLFRTAAGWYMFGVFTVALSVCFSSFCNRSAAVLLGTGGVVGLSYLLEMLPRVRPYLPTVLTDVSAIAPNPPAPAAGVAAFLITACLSLAALAASLPIFSKRAL